ncbi:MAG: DUF1343 domain-containing protein [Desulfobulbaceae bacterium]|uniref:DUF1343 domain-containing protein n=1 Tax=Candidatus Desulfatifera sulfidica TaxID=2841691 RepID=A0A8J6TBF4_9BACT|nr:DUF1343 domain-containing protein [Candidatus Desulfatifera sulfidica]
MIETGLEQLLHKTQPQLAGKRLGLLCNQASTDRHLRHARDLIAAHPDLNLTCLFSPQHGFFSEKQDNMIESGHGCDPVTGLPLFSLYGETRRPTAAMFAELDVLLVDLVDVGTRVYTFLYTLVYCLEAAVAFDKEVVVLDRPNPIGGELIEGNLLRSDCQSFVGLYPLPMRHGLTFGELAMLINQEYGIGARLRVIPMRGWNRGMLYGDTGLPWVFPSPNMPTPDTALVYPGQVLWEGTTDSEGRGTTRPFELVGAPYWQHGPILKKLAECELPGCVLRPLIFEPTSGKWAGEACVGFQIHVTDAVMFRPYRTSLALFQAILLFYPSQFGYKEPPYEYEFERLPMDLILGDKQLRLDIEAGVPILDLEAGWQSELAEFEKLRRNYFLYTD